MLDHVLPGLTGFVIQGILRSITVAIAVCLTNPFLVIVVIFGLWFMGWVFRESERAMKGAQKLEQEF